MSVAHKFDDVTIKPGSCHAFVGDETTKQAVSSTLARHPQLKTLVQTSGMGAALAQPEPGQEPPGLLIVDISGTADPAAEVAILMAVTDPRTKVIAIGSTNDVGLFRELLAAGVVDYLVKPVEPRALESAIMAAHRSPEKGTKAEAAPAAKIAAFMGTRGGIGATTAAINTAWLLAERHQKKVALVDLDIHFGTVGFQLGVESGGGLREALDRPERIDTLFVDRAMAKLTDRLHVLSGEEPLSENPGGEVAGGKALLQALNPKFDWLVFDLPRALGPAHRFILSSAQHAVVCCELSLAGVRDAGRITQLLKEIAPSVAADYVACGNVQVKSGRVSQGDFEKTVGRKLTRSFSFDPKVATAASLAGKPLVEMAKASKIAKEFEALAQAFAGPEDVKKVPLWKKIWA